MRSRLFLLAFIAAASFAGLLACRVPSTQPDTLAEVGGVTITVEDLLHHPAATQALDDLINDAVVLLECQYRGIVLDVVKYQQNLDAFISQQGGKEQMEKSMKENKVGWPDFFNYQRVQILSNQLAEAMAGKPTDEEITQHFVQNEDRLRRLVANRLDIDPSAVTLNDAWEDIIKEITSQKAGEIKKNLTADLRAKYGIKNYLTGEGLKPGEEKKEDEGLAGKLDISEGETKEPEGSTAK